MRYLVALGHDLGGFRLAVDCAGDGFLRCAIIEVLNFFVVGSLPMDEDADTDVEIVGLILGNDPLSHAVSNCLGDRMLSGAEHLHSLLSAFDRHLVEQDSRGLAHKVWRHQCEQRRETVLVVVRQVANAVSAALPRGPIMRSIWATSLPSPTSDSPIQS